MKKLYKMKDGNNKTYYEITNNGELFYRIAKTQNYYTVYIFNNYYKMFTPSRYFARLKDAKKALHV